MSPMHKIHEDNLYGQPTLYNSGHRAVPEVSLERVKHSRRMFWIRLTALLAAVVVAVAAAIAIMAVTINWDNKVTNSEGARSVRRADPAPLGLKIGSLAPVVTPFLTSSIIASFASPGVSAIPVSEPSAFASASFSNITTMNTITLPGTSATTLPSSFLTGWNPPNATGTGYSRIPLSSGTRPHYSYFTASSVPPYGNSSDYHYYLTGSTGTGTGGSSWSLTGTDYETASDVDCTESVTVTVTVTASHDTYDSVPSYTEFATPTAFTSDDDFTETETTTVTPTFTTFQTTTVDSVQIITVLDTVSGTLTPVTTLTVVDGQPPFTTDNSTATGQGTAISTGFPTASGAKPIPTDDGTNGEFSGRNQLNVAGRLGRSTATMLGSAAIAALVAMW
ncbi:hypothetical protein CFIMG_008174RA00001 [Ceratocystis fimbriata CBS 114723]|uniref:Uncharacterized protein n=1 Tax=Ceratocystis fimbriata CBS 114723 TaxID=1035309 RepID=A0A2C5X6J1_9PEZI|nr:hypothetical protein CFIMG_008174RA00001 [Ceratocystis fimbriata CBS 114723]